MPVLRPSLRLRPSRRGVRAFAPLPANDRLAALPPIADNPGKLAGRLYVPNNIAGPAPLVVVLHGCTQNAALYDHGSGWSALADKHGFILLFPEQNRTNNPLLCFNWFLPDDSGRGMGEAASIANMIAAVKAAHDVDPDRVFVTGLSAGGAMASVMLATYPELFAAGEDDVDRLVAGGQALSDGVASILSVLGDGPLVHVLEPRPDVIHQPRRARSCRTRSWPRT